jgi:Na+-transporting methylmalonyl-CoA/oxaloacetate decarboxylase gamma subunit
MMTTTLDAALKIGGLGMAGVFAFMVIFYAAIRMIDFWFPKRDGHEEER